MKAGSGKIALAGWCLLAASPSAAITEEVAAGESVSNGSVNSVVTQQVYGETENYSVMGKQEVMSGGVTHNSNIYSYGQQDVLSGGTSFDTLIQYYAVQNVDGKAYASSVNSRGVIDVNAGGYVKSTVVNGGSLFIDEGAVAEETVLNSGKVYLSGKDSAAKISGGTYEIKSGGVSEQAQISGGLAQVDSGAAINCAVLSGRGEIEADGTVTDIRIESGGEMTIHDGGTATDTTLSGGEMTLDEEAEAYKTTLLSGTEYVYGTDTGARISGGTQIVEGGGKVAQSIISAGGIQQIGFYGTSEDVTVENGGTQQVDWEGTALRTTVSAGGNLEVSAGGTASDTALSAGEMQVSGTAKQTTITGGSLEVSAGGTVTDTVISAGEMQVAGTAAGVAVNSGGTVEVMSGGNAENMVLNGGTAHINQGGENTAAIVNAGTEYVAGISRSATLNHNGTQIVQSGGISTGAVVNYAANQQVASGGVSEKAQVNGGTQTVAGTAQSTELMKGQQDILSGGTAENTYITGGIQTIASGAKTINTTADGGTVTLNSGGLMSGKNVLRNATLTINGSNHIADLELENTLLSIAKKPEFSTLQIDNLNGSGLISLSSDLSQNIADKLDVRNGSGEFGLIIHDYSAEGKLPLSFKLIDENAAAADSFYLVGDAVDIGAFKYDLRMDGADWILQRTQDHTDSAVIAKNTYASLSSLFYAHLTSLYTRLRHTRGEIKHHNGLWAKSFGREIRFSYKDKTKSTTEAYGAAFGYDGVLWQNNKGSLLAGVFGALSDSRQKYDRNGRGDGKTESLGLYSTWQSVDNWFIDIAGTYFWHKQKIKSYTPSGYDVDGKYHTNAYQASLHAGKRWDIGAAWFLEPYVGLNYMRVDSISYRTNFNTLVKADAADYMGGTAGISAGQGITLPNGGNMDIYGRAAVVYDWDGKSPLVVAEEIFMEDTSSVRYELGAGFSASFGSRGTVYADMSTQLGSRVRFPWEFNLGLQFNF